ncbi:hypothetical protein ACFQX6_23930 [Streptosporangium lutulentum]
MIGLRRVAPDEFTLRLDSVLDVYTAAMNPPSDQLSGRKAIMRNHAIHPGFTCLFAESADGTPVGVAYGFHGDPGQWWHDVVRRALAEKNGEEAPAAGSATPWNSPRSTCTPTTRARVSAGR